MAEVAAGLTKAHPQLGCWGSTIFPLLTGAIRALRKETGIYLGFYMRGFQGLQFRVYEFGVSR